ncbi:MAG: CoA ester lyase [Alphaproteobacteria bacterium]|nr:MAG: CoA ester lyase [Alphaproteobacteria bacterium]
MTLPWRSLIYVPAHIEKFVSSPRILEADAVILDLQDSVPGDAKAEARARIEAAARHLGGAGQNVLVRINEGKAVADKDLEVCVGAGIETLVVPQIRSVNEINQLDLRLSELETGLNRVPGSTKLLVLIESAAGIVSMAAIAKASSRIVALNIGNEDLATDLGVAPTEDALRVSRQLLVIAAVAAGVTPLGLVASGADFTDLDAYRLLAEGSRRLGFCGASCIHPSQIAVLNKAFGPSAEEMAWAHHVLDAARSAKTLGQAAFALEGRMIDPPIVARAENIIQRHAVIEARQLRRQPTG